VNCKFIQKITHQILPESVRFCRSCDKILVFFSVYNSSCRSLTKREC